MDKNNNRKKPQEGKDYKVVKGDDGKTTVYNLRHPDNKYPDIKDPDMIKKWENVHEMVENRKTQKSEAEDILEMIRARQEHSPSNDSTKLREFLNNLPDDTVEVDYSRTPIYKLGWEDGHEAGYDRGYQEAYFVLFKVLKAIETIIEPHIEKEC